MSASQEIKNPPLAPNCLVCGIPLVGLTAVFLRWRGIRRSPRNPHCCTQCGAHLEEGRLVEMTVVFADLSSFTAMTGSLGATTTYSVVDEFLRLASTTLVNHGAFIDKYIGDAVMALFNVPINATTMRRRRSRPLQSSKSFFPNFPDAWTCPCTRRSE